LVGFSIAATEEALASLAYEEGKHRSAGIQRPLAWRS